MRLRRDQGQQFSITDLDLERNLVSLTGAVVIEVDDLHRDPFPGIDSQKIFLDLVDRPITASNEIIGDGLDRSVVVSRSQTLGERSVFRLATRWQFIDVN